MLNYCKPSELNTDMMALVDVVEDVRTDVRGVALCLMRCADENGIPDPEQLSMLTDVLTLAADALEGVSDALSANER